MGDLMAHEIRDRTFRLTRDHSAIPGSWVFGRWHRNGVEHGYVAVLIGGTFHAIPCDADHESAHRQSEGEFNFIGHHPGVLYGPVDPSTTLAEVEGARYAWDDGERYHFAHCSPGEQRELAARAEAFAVDQFADAIRTAVAAGALADANIARNTAHAKATALIAYSRSVGRRVHGVVVGATLGAFHAVKADHFRILTVDAIRHTLAVLKQNSAADSDSRALHGRVQEAAAAIVTRLTEAPTIETRAAREQRFIRLTARGQDPVDGKEYVFTAAANDAPITAAADLPDAAWPFDSAALKAGVVRGSFRYFDGIPGNISPELPWAIRYSRPASGGNWKRDGAWRIYGGT